MLEKNKNLINFLDPMLRNILKNAAKNKTFARNEVGKPFITGQIITISVPFWIEWEALKGISG